MIRTTLFPDHMTVCSQAPLRRYWTDPRLEPDEVFLRDFILNKGYIDKDAVRIPTYDEIVDDESDQPGDSEDEEALDKQEDFERKFNFRFEEPGGHVIGHVMSCESSLSLWVGDVLTFDPFRWGPDYELSPDGVGVCEERRRQEENETEGKGGEEG